MALIDSCQESSSDPGELNTKWVFTMQMCDFPPAIAISLFCVTVVDQSAELTWVRVRQ